MAKWEQSPLIEQEATPKWSQAPLAESDPSMIPEELDDQKDRIRDADYYAKTFGIPPEEAFDLQAQLNKGAFGQERLAAEPAKLFTQAFVQSMASKPAMMLRGVQAYTPGKALGLDPLLDKASMFIESLKDPDVAKRVQAAAEGKLWPVGDERKWWQVEARYLPEVINAWATNVGDQIPIMLTTVAGRMAGKVLGKGLGMVAGAGAALVTGGPDPTDVATAPAVVGISQEVGKHLGGAAPLVAMEAGNFLDQASSLQIDPDISEKYAKLYGVGSGAIEYAQWLWVLGRYSKIAKQAQQGILKTVLKHIGGSAFEGLEEVSQGGLQNWLLGKAVSEMKERHPDYQGEAPSTWEGAKRDGAIGSGVAFLTGLPGTGMTITEGARVRMATVKPETKKFLGEPSVQEIQRAEKAEHEPSLPAEGAAAVAAGAEEAAPTTQVQREVPEAVVPAPAGEVVEKAAGKQAVESKTQHVPTIGWDDTVPSKALSILDQQFYRTMGGAVELPERYYPGWDGITLRDLIGGFEKLGLGEEIIREASGELYRAGYTKIGNIRLTEEGPVSESVEPTRQPLALPAEAPAEIVLPAATGEAEKAGARDIPIVGGPSGGLGWQTPIREALRKVKEIRPQIVMEQHEERAKRAARLEALKNDLIEQGIEPEQAMERSKAALSGPLTDYQRYEGIRNYLQPETISAAFRDIATTDRLRPYDRTNTFEAFSKLVDGYMLAPFESELILRWQPSLRDIVDARTDRSSYYRMATTLWRAGLLTGIKTSGLNIFSNFSHAMSEVMKDVPGAGADIAQSWFTGRRTLGLTLEGLGKGTEQGVRKGLAFLKTGYDDRDVQAKYDHRKTNFGDSRFARGVQLYEEIVFRLLGAEDQPFYYAAKAHSLRSQAIAMGRNQGLKAKALQEFADRKIEDPTDEMLKYAVIDAETAVFQNETALGEMAAAIQRHGGEIVVPFSRTPSAIAMQVLNYTPVGVAKEAIHQLSKGKYDQRLISQAFGRSVTGTTVLGMGAALFAVGLLSLDYPDNEKERNLWAAEGRKENAIRIGDKWRSVYVLGPLGNLLLVGGYILKGYKETGSPTAALTTGLSGMGKSILEETFLRGLNQFIEALRDPERSFETFFSSLAGSIVPTLVADIARATDSTERRSKGPLERMKSRVPGLRETLEPKLDMFGQDLPRYGGNILESMADPTRPVKVRQDVVVDELRRLWDKDIKVSPTTLGNKAGYEVLSDHENTLLWRRAGELTYDGLLRLIQTERYKRLTNERKGEEIEKIVQQARDIARAEMTVAKMEAGVPAQELIEGKLVTQNVTRLVNRMRNQRSIP